MSDDDVDVERDMQRELKRLTRRGFLTAAVAAGAGYTGWKWLRTRPRELGLEWPLRRALEANESLSHAYFSRARLSPEFERGDLTRPRVNGRLGLELPVDPDSWRLRIEGGPSPAALTMDDLRAMPRHEMITELRCIEGWSTINQWAGVQLGTLVHRYIGTNVPRYIGIETPDRGYYVGLDIESALHPQTLLAYEMNGAPLTDLHGAPLRLAIPVKYGIKNIKRIGTIRLTNVRPADFWGERGYDWYSGH
jgi:DMSO/TMAO reductase YedYZ molybdopterin-dependent catalytic subunit